MPNKKVLLVDDDKAVIEQLKLPLTVKGYDIYEAYDGLQALEIIRKEIPNIVVLDILMPKLDGLKLICLFKKDERYQHIPVIMVSHIAKAQDEQYLKNLGFKKFFSKPFQVEEVISAIDKFVKQDAPKK